MRQHLAYYTDVGYGSVFALINRLTIEMGCTSVSAICCWVLAVRRKFLTWSKCLAVDMMPSHVVDEVLYEPIEVCFVGVKKERESGTPGDNSSGRWRQEWLLSRHRQPFRSITTPCLVHQSYTRHQHLHTPHTITANFNPPMSRDSRNQPHCLRSARIPLRGTHNGGV